MKDPKKIKEIINIMQDVYNNISGWKQIWK
jgi:hypothetical protein